MQPNTCQDDTATPGLDCGAVGGNEGACLVGPFDGHCSIQTAATCTSTADCNPPPAGTCDDCVSGQTCVQRARPCFTDNGQVGNAIAVTGSTEVPCGGNASTSLGALFCVAPYNAGLVNASQGLPGLGRVRLPAEVSFLP